MIPDVFSVSTLINDAGEMEMTFMKAACRAANIPVLLGDPEVRSMVGDLSNAYSNFTDEDQRGTRIHDTLSLQPANLGRGKAAKNARLQPLCHEVYVGLLARLNEEAAPGLANEKSACLYVPRPKKQPGQRFLADEAIQCTEVQINGVRFQPVSASSGNCNAIYYFPSSQEPIPGQIVEIFLHTRRLSDKETIEETFLVARPYIPLSHTEAKHDNYRRYPLVGGSLYYDKFQETTHILRPRDVKCHFAMTKVAKLDERNAYETPRIHVLPLDRVSPNLYSWSVIIINDS